MNKDVILDCRATNDQAKDLRQGLKAYNANALPGAKVKMSCWLRGLALSATTFSIGQSVCMDKAAGRVVRYRVRLTRTQSRDIAQRGRSWKLSASEYVIARALASTAPKKEAV